MANPVSKGRRSQFPVSSGTVSRSDIDCLLLVLTLKQAGGYLYDAAVG